MPKNLLLPIILGGFFLSALAIYASALETPAATAAFLAAVLAHTPALLPVSAHGRLLPRSAGAIGQFPEIFVIAALTATWACGTIVVPAGAPYVLSAAATLFAIAFGYAAVRAVAILDRVARRKNVAPKSVEFPGTAHLSARFAYLARAAAAGTSFVTFAAFLGGQSPLPYAVALSITTVIVCAAVLLHAKLSLAQAVRTMSQGIEALMARQLAAKPVDVVVYHSGNGNAKIEATSQLLLLLSERNISCALMVREEEAMKALQASPARHHWFAPTIATLGSCAMDGFDTVLYAHEAAKNVHFTRYNQYRHILFTEFTDLGDVDTLPAGMVIYDDIVAPNLSQANRWRAAAPTDLARRISVVTNAYEPAQRLAGARPVVSLHCAPQPAPENISPSLSEDSLRNLISSAAKDRSIALQLWFPLNARGANRQLLQSLQSRLNEFARNDLHQDKRTLDAPPQISFHAGTEADAANAADILVGHAQSNLDALLCTGKPILLAETWDGAPDITTISPSSNGFRLALKTVTNRAEDTPTQPPARRHFPTLDELCGFDPRVTSLKEAM